MPVSKLKNLILLILALAAAFLLLLVVPPRLALRQERQAVYDRLQAFLAENGVELTEDEIRTLTWIAGWESRTVENLCSAIRKVRL